MWQVEVIQDQTSAGFQQRPQEPLHEACSLPLQSPSDSFHFCTQVDKFPYCDFKGFNDYGEAVTFMCGTAEGLQWAVQTGAIPPIGAPEETVREPEEAQHAPQVQQAALPPVHITQASAFTSTSYQSPGTTAPGPGSEASPTS